MTADTDQRTVCWHDDEHADWRRPSHYWGDCPGVKSGHIVWGRCRSGGKWFWAATLFSGIESGDTAVHGWADTEEAAITDARASVVELASGCPASASTSHGHARHRLKEINAEKRRNRPSNGGTDAGVVEYLYGTWWHNEDCVHHLVQFQITKKTGRRIYYLRDHGGTGFVDRQELEETGEVYNRGRHPHEPDWHLHAEPPELRPSRIDPADTKAELAQLRREMANAHPDRGGTSEGFMAARRRYKDALGRARTGARS